ncbi:MAG: histidine kinase [Alphaproteobacteria bacterium BRH_c36]|nr:MAG: histidine kinase [Alphaproteobacteria bacterium BRH_c36]
MPTKTGQPRYGSSYATTGRELMLLLVASLACALVLTAGIVKGQGSTLAGLSVSQLAVIVLTTVGGLVAAMLVFKAASEMRRQVRAAQDEAAALKRQLAIAEAVIGGEPQILILWDTGLQPHIVNNSLREVAGLPCEDAEIVSFSSWLDAGSAARFKEALDGLLRVGRPFNMILKTAAGAHVETDGRASGGRAVLRMRDVAGYKREISRIIDGHEGLARDIRSSRAILNALPMPVWFRDNATRLSWVNQAYIAAVEAENLDQVIERQIELLEQRQREELSKTLQTTSRLRRRIGLLSGNERRVHNLLAVRLQNTVVAAAIDVTDLEVAQHELDRQSAAFDRTLDHVSTAIAVFNAEQRLVFANEAFVRLWDLDQQWLRGQPKDTELFDRLRELGRLPEVVNYRQWRTTILDSNEPIDEGDRWWHLPDGRIVQLIAEQRPDGGVTHLYIDETERLALESEFNAMLRVQSETIDSLKEGVAVVATDGRLKLFNSAFAAIWCIDTERLATGPHIDDIVDMARPLFDEADVWSRLKQAATALSDQRVPIEGQMLRRDSSVVDFSVMPLPDGATLLTFADVTASRRYERALVERNEALVAADRLKNQFIGHVSYELRTPLTNIIGFTELLGSPHMGDLNEKQREYLRHIASSSNELLWIIDGILDLATIDAGALELHREDVDVREVISSAISAVEDRAARADLTLDVAIADDVTFFSADKARLRQGLYNLLSNAVGFSNEGGTVFVSCWREMGRMVFRIEDTGVGIPHEDQERMFERFESNSRGLKHRGAGLGLSIVKSLVELHGGTMRLVSAPGAGTRVTVFLPEKAPVADHSRSVADIEGETLAALPSALRDTGA